jgi:UMF1 family MFS transporter
MFFLEGDAYLFAGLLYLVAALGASASVVFYNAFLPDIASPNRRDAVSSNGWAIGYLGSGLLLALNLALLAQAPALGLTTAQAVRISLASAGLWWAVFSLVPLAVLRNRLPMRELPPSQGYLLLGFRELRRTLGRANAYPQTLLFLAASTAYGVGIATVLTLSAQFGQEEMALPIATVTTALSGRAASRAPSGPSARSC